jgi:hypothetical protein
LARASPASTASPGLVVLLGDQICPREVAVLANVVSCCGYVRGVVADLLVDVAERGLGRDLLVSDLVGLGVEGEGVFVLFDGTLELTPGVALQ